MNRYNNGKIYKIVDVGYNQCYIGSTCESLSQRMARHRQAHTFFKNGGRIGATVCHMFDEFGVDNCKIELIENYPCDNKEELLKREGYHIYNNECINRCLTGRTPKEYKQYYNPLNREKIKSGLKEWYERTKEERKHINKQYRDNHKEESKVRQSQTVECENCGSIITIYKLNRHKETKKCKSFNQK